MPDSLLYWRIKKLKEMGSNAYRCSHNPPTAELLDACDRLGMVVMDETRHLGDTYSPKTSRGTGYTDLSDLKALLQRDRNAHPSLLMWSLCNEEGLQGSAEGARLVAAMKAVVHLYDTSTTGHVRHERWMGQSGISNVEDLQGCNYNSGGYDDFHRTHLQQPMCGSETASTVSTRGIYANDPVRGYVSAYDANYPSWAQTAEDAWRPIAERDFIALRLTTDSKTLVADGEDVTMVEVAVVDAQGRVVPTADNLVQFTVSGEAARVCGVGNRNRQQLP